MSHRYGEGETDSWCSLLERCTDPNNLASSIEERAAAVAGVDGRVCLKEIGVLVATIHEYTTPVLSTDYADG